MAALEPAELAANPQGLRQRAAGSGRKRLAGTLLESGQPAPREFGGHPDECRPGALEMRGFRLGDDLVEHGDGALCLVHAGQGMGAQQIGGLAMAWLGAGTLRQFERVTPPAFGVG